MLLIYFLCIPRFHVYCSHFLCEEEMHIFDSKINLENLTKCLQTLKHMYEDHLNENVNIILYNFKNYWITNNINVKCWVNIVKTIFFMSHSNLYKLSNIFLFLQHCNIINYQQNLFLFFKESNMSKRSRVSMLPNFIEFEWW